LPFKFPIVWFKDYSSGDSYEKCDDGSKYPVPKEGGKLNGACKDYAREMTGKRGAGINKTKKQRMSQSSHRGKV